MIYPPTLIQTSGFFADDCVVYRQIVNDHDHQYLQEDLYSLEKW